MKLNHDYLFSVLSTALVKKFIAHSDLENLEQVVLSGHGHVLIGETAADSQIRAFIKATPTYLVSAFPVYVRVMLRVMGYLIKLRENLYNFATNG